MNQQAVAQGGGFLQGLGEAAAALGFKLSVLGPALVGGWIALHFYRERNADGTVVANPSAATKAKVVVGGGVIGTISGPAGAAILEMGHRPGVEQVLALFLAIFGMALIAAVHRALHDIDLKGVIESWLRRK